MSFDQSRSDKSDTQHRKSGRSAAPHQQRSSSYSKGGGGGGGGLPAPSPSSSSTSLTSSRSFKKSSHGQGGQYRVNSPALGSSESAAAPHRNLQNGAQQIHSPSSHATSIAPVSFGTTAKPLETTTIQKVTRSVPKAPTSQPASLTSDIASSLPPPANNSGDASKFAFQFGSLGPVALNGMQIPARTSSAPPNLDEQKRDQARHEAFKSVPPLPIPTPKQQLPRKEPTTTEQSIAGDGHPVSKARRDVQATTAPLVSQTQKSSVITVPMTSMQMPFHQPPVSVQFGGPNPQIQTQGVPPSSLQVPMPMAALPMGNAPQVQQPMFVQGLQPHPMQPQGIMHQGQGLSFTPQMGPQLPPQLGNMGIGVTSRYPQQQGGKFGGPRKTTVKITDPNTHEELRLDKRTDTYTDGGASGLRSHPSVPSQPQPIPSFPSTHHMNYYPNSYNHNNLFFQPSSSVPLTSGQIPPNSQQPRYNYSVSQGPQNVSFVNPSAVNPKPINVSGAPMHGMTDPSNLDHARDVHNVISSTSSGTVQVKVKPAVTSIGEKNVDSHSVNNSSAVEKTALVKPSMESNLPQLQKDSENAPESSSQHSKAGSESTVSKSFPTPSKQSEVPCGSGTFISSSSTQSEKSVLAGSNTEGKRKETLSRSNSIKDHQKKPGKKGYVQLHKIGGQPTTVSGFSSSVEQGTSSVIGDAGSLETKTILSSANNEGLTESVQESVSSICPPTSDVSNDSREHATDVTSEIPGSHGIADTKDVSHQAMLEDSSLQGNVKYETQEAEDKTDKGSHGVPKQDDNISELSLEPVTSEMADPLSARQSKSGTSEIAALVVVNEALDGSFTHDPENNRIVDNVDVSTSRNLDFVEVGKSLSGDTKVLDASSSYSDSTGDKDVCTVKSTASDQQDFPGPTPGLPIAASVEEVMENTGDGIVPHAVSNSKEKAVELTRSKSTAGRLKKKRKEILQKADAAGTTSDLYMAYKGPEEKKESSVATEATESISTGSDLMQEPAGTVQLDSITSEKGLQSKVEPDDWEDAADMSTPKLETSDTVEQGLVGVQLHGQDGSGNTVKKYSRDFLLKFSELCCDLPERFEITADIADALMNVGVSHVEREPYPSPGRVVDRSNSGSRMDRRGGGMADDDRWSKLPGAFAMGRDLRLDIGFGGNAGFRPGQVVNYGVLRNPRAQTPVQFTGGILTGPMQSMGSQAVMQRNSPDTDRWQRATNFQQKGLIPSPQSPLQMMHKAERKYEVGKVTDEEEAKQRRLKAILNKLTPQNFEKLFEQVKEVNIDNADTLNGVISQIFDKALMEPTFCEMYANFCYYLAGELPDFIEDNERITFKRLLLNKCQEEFERGEREQEEANKADEEGETKQSEEEREEKRTKARRRMLGNIRLIGELYKKKMLTERIMHECIKKLLGQYQNPDEEDVEALCKLMSTIGEMIDHPKAKEHMDFYFDIMTKLSNNMKLSSRVRFMLKDAIDLRKNKWQQRRKVEGPKKIDEVHRDAAQERHHQTSRLSRNPSINPSPRRAPMDFGPRGSAMLSSPNAQMGGFHGLTAQVRGYGTQDIRFEERQSYEARTFSVPLPKPLGDDSITLGPQGGLARGMSFRGPPAMTGAPLADVPPSSGDSNRMGAGLNGISMVSERPTYSSREEFFPRYTDRFTVPATFDESITHERNLNYVNRDPRNQDRSLDRSHATSPPGRAQAQAASQITPSEKVWPEERLRDMSMAAIREFYSARDEKEVALCIKELNSLSFHPSMISLWVTDSFERKDMERDLLAKLLVNLARSHDRILSPPQLIKGFESVLSTLEDAVNDAPRAAEFLGRILAKAVLENVVPLREFGQLLHEGGEEPGRLLEIGLAGDVLGSTLETIRAEKGENVLNEICMSSNLHLEDFRPPPPNRSRILEKLI